MTHRPPAPPSALRRRVERASAGPMIWLGRRRPLVFVAFVVLVVTTFALSGPVSLATGVPLLAVVGWVTYHSWPAVPPQGRAVRLVVLVVIAALVLTHAAA